MLTTSYKQFAISSYVAAKVLRVFSINRVEQDNAVRAERGVALIARQNRVVKERAIALVPDAVSNGFKTAAVQNYVHSRDSPF